MPSLRGGYFGDQMVRVVIEVPTALTSEQRQKLEEFALACGDADRKGVKPRFSVDCVFAYLAAIFGVSCQWSRHCCL